MHASLQVLIGPCIRPAASYCLDDLLNNLPDQWAPQAHFGVFIWHLELDSQSNTTWGKHDVEANIE